MADLSKEERKQIESGCFNFVIAVLGAFAIGGVWGWPAGVVSLIIALCALRLFRGD